MCKFCYGIIDTLNAYNVVAVRYDAEYLEMLETVEKRNLIYKIEVFLSSIFRGWRDSIIVLQILQSTRSLLPCYDDLKLVSHCIDSIASKVCMDISKVNWSYTYSRKRFTSENGHTRQQLVPKDWWIEDLCELLLDLYSRVLLTIKAKDRVLEKVIGEALRAYAYRKLPGFGKGSVTERNNDMLSYCWDIAIREWFRSCSFLLKLLGSVGMLHCSENFKRDLVKKIGRQLDEAHLSDLLFPANGEENAMYDVEMFLSIVKQFVMIERQDPGLVFDSNKIAVGKSVDGYLMQELGIAESRLLSLKQPEDFARALDLGQDKGTVAVIVDEFPYVELFLSTYCKYRIIGQEFTKSGWFGVICSQQGDIVTLNITNQLLKVYFAMEIANIPWLTKVILSNKNITSIIPNSIATLQ
ncbi:hypothetical protein IEQ34_014703 [Dendrobium chrysotoxum]|uniref:NPH3 domain-containing protein n=1 Tax=Dendrobium chrysotoxum TaxID=161865 RepID=A0AAV7GJU1_DENCH|nr:hypothetical protein IEQ34_014703 [Dendrobium chrysotoxum]